MSGMNDAKVIHRQSNVELLWIISMILIVFFSLQRIIYSRGYAGIFRLLTHCFLYATFIAMEYMLHLSRWL